MLKYQVLDALDTICEIVDIVNFRVGSLRTFDALTGLAGLRKLHSKS